MSIKESICLVLLSVIGIAAHGRTVASALTGEPIIYASVGVINRNLGTVTDTTGNFSLSIPMEYVNDSVRISSVGFVAKTFAVKDIHNLPDTIYLADEVIALKEIVVKSQKIRHKTAGRKGGGGFIAVEVEGYKAAGQGLSIPLKVKKQAWLKEIGFDVTTDGRPLSRMKFRVNVYRKDGGDYLLSVMMPASFPLRVKKSARKPDEILTMK